MIEIVFVCNDCGKRASARGHSFNSTWQDSTGSHQMSGSIEVPVDFRRYNPKKQCNVCYEAENERMKPVWKAKEEARQAETKAKVVSDFITNRQAILDRFSSMSIGSSADRDFLTALGKVLLDDAHHSVRPLPRQA